MMEITGKDFVYSVLLHATLILALVMLNPFALVKKKGFDAVEVNIIQMPPLGNPELIKGAMPDITIPQAIIEDEVAIPISAPESKTKKYDISKQKETPKPKPKPKEDAGYKGNAQKGETSQKGTEVGDKLGPGSKFGSVSVDNANFDYPYYFIQAFGKIQNNWSNPVNANQTLSCVIYFEIIRSGTVLDPKIEKTSGVTAYDRACLRAVQASNPLPPLPSDFSNDIIGIHLEFPYQPR